jgi:sarcosine oxidase, subunit delta
MLLIACPWCGPRAEIEFVWGGEAHLVRPEPPQDVSDAAWGAYLYVRNNVQGPHAERWRHAHGCGQWFNLIRDTATHQILAVYRMDEAPPAAAGRPEAAQ